MADSLVLEIIMIIYGLLAASIYTHITILHLFCVYTYWNIYYINYIGIKQQ